MLWLEKGLYVRIVELENGPRPLPLSSGFNCELAYRVLGCFNASESSDAFYILANDRDEIWFICNRHLRVLGLFPDKKDFRIEIINGLRH